ncbi:MAG: glycosyltransferase family 4 protein [Candidatus Binatia bacterium]
MRIGVDATCWQNIRGYGRHARGLLRALVRLDQSNRYVFFLDVPEPRASLPAEAEIRVVRNALPAALAASADGHRSALDLWKMSRAMSAREFDLLLFPTVYSYVPVLSGAKKIVMIHDIIAETFPELTVPKTAARLFWKTKVGLGRWQADAIVTVSDYSRKGIIDHFRTAPEKVFVVGEANDPIFRVIDDPQPSARFRALGIVPGVRSVVYVGGFGPHKNLDRLLSSFAALADQPDFGDVILVMAGEYEKEVFHSTFQTIKNRVRELGLTNRVIFTGHLTDDDLVNLLNLATVLVLPSLMEGFGLPAVEAAACGCPVIATKASPLPGLLGEGALYIDPTAEHELQQALKSVLTSEELRQRMRRAGLAAAGRLTWDAAAKQMREVLDQVAIS